MRPLPPSPTRASRPSHGRHGPAGAATRQRRRCAVGRASRPPTTTARRILATLRAAAEGTDRAAGARSAPTRSATAPMPIWLAARVAGARRRRLCPSTHVRIGVDDSTPTWSCAACAAYGEQAGTTTNHRGPGHGRSPHQVTATGNEPARLDDRARAGPALLADGGFAAGPSAGRSASTVDDVTAADREPPCPGSAAATAGRTRDAAADGVVVDPSRGTARVHRGLSPTCRTATAMTIRLVVSRKLYDRAVGHPDGAARSSVSRPVSAVHTSTRSIVESDSGVAAGDDVKVVSARGASTVLPIRRRRVACRAASPGRRSTRSGGTDRGH